MNIRAQLQEKGFLPGRIEAALRNTDGTYEKALEWLENNNKLPQVPKERLADNPDDISILHNSNINIDSNNNDDTIEKPKILSPEEKEKKLQEIRARVAKKKAIKEAEFKENDKRNEVIRKKRDVEMIKFKEEQAAKETKKAIQDRKKEAMETALAKQKVKREIEAAKVARAKERERLSSTNPQSNIQPVTQSNLQKNSQKDTSNSTIKQSRLQIRYNNLPNITETFPIETTLYEVATKLQEKTNMDPNNATFTTTYPRKTYSADDLKLSLLQTGLINSVVLLGYTV